MSDSPGKSTSRQVPAQGRSAPRPVSTGREGLWSMRFPLLLVVATGFFGMVGIVMAVFVTLQVVAVLTSSDDEITIADAGSRQSISAERAPMPSNLPSAPSPPPEPTKGPEPAPAERQPQEPPEEPDPAPALTKDPFEDIRACNRLLPLPKRNFTLGSTGAKSVELAKVFVDSAEDCDLSLLGDQCVLDGMRMFVIDRKDERDGTRTWTVYTQTGKITISRPPSIGQFSLKDQSLKFQWNRGAQPGVRGSVPPWSPRSGWFQYNRGADSWARPQHLPYCLLQIQVGQQSERCILHKPDEVELPKIDWKAKPPYVAIPLDPNFLPKSEHLHVDLKPEGFPKHEIAPATGLNVGGKSIIKVEPQDEGNQKKGLLEIEVYFRLGEKPGLFLKTFAYPKILQRNGQTTEKREPMPRSQLDEFAKQCSRKRIVQIETNIRKVKAEIVNVEKGLQNIDGELGGFKAEKGRAEKLKATLKFKRDKDRCDDDIRHCNGIIGVLNEKKEKLQKTLDALRSQMKAQQELKRFTEENNEWCKNISKLFDELEKNSRIGFAVYAEIEGERIDIVRTKGN